MIAWLSRPRSGTNLGARLCVLTLRGELTPRGPERSPGQERGRTQGQGAGVGVGGWGLGSGELGACGSGLPKAREPGSKLALGGLPG